MAVSNSAVNQTEKKRKITQILERIKTMDRQSIKKYVQICISHVFPDV